MIELKCPIHNMPLEECIGYDGDYSCAKCGRAKMFGSEELWQALTDSMKEYDLCHDALVGRTKELDRTRKALDVAKDTIRHADWFFDGDYNVDAKTMHNEIKCAIKGITALEQKE